MINSVPHKLWFRVRIAGSEPLQSLSQLLQGEICATYSGALDEPALYARLCKLGFEPAWIKQDGSVALSLYDPVAGAVVLQCETIAVTLH
ncbi:hypothetical protein [Pseudomonas caricapapayae]|uniref:hypothetical protein n=1 Tax=Pseudomonas caricapapayae TaxID=46678 RepID=UPI000EFF5CC8|nr:hypothetical protein [Pseudomonas caricapapayae]